MNEWSMMSNGQENLSAFERLQLGLPKLPEESSGRPSGSGPWTEEELMRTREASAFDRIDQALRKMPAPR